MSKLNLMTRDGAGNGTAKVAEMMVRLRAATEPHRREATVVSDSINVEARTVELSFSSEVEYERWWGIEVLGHDAHEVDLSRLSNKAALLWMHNWSDQRGVVESVRIDSDRKGRAIVRFSKSALGEQLFQDIIDGIVTKVSVGYTIDGLKLVEERDNIDVYRVTSWTPYEISMVSVPADDTVGVGRNAENPREEPKAEPAETGASVKPPASTRITTKDKKHMEYRYFRDAQGNLCKVAKDENGNDVGQAVIVEAAGAERSAGTAAERARTDGILALADSYAGQLPQARELSAKFIKEGKTAEEFQRALLDEFKTKSNVPLSEQSRSGDSELGMSDADVGRYSFANVIRALANPNDKAAQKAAAFEIECSLEAQRTLGRSAQGILVPPDVLSRTMSTTQQGAGAAFIDTSKMPMLDLLRNRMVMMKMATVISGLVGNVDIPKRVSDGQAYWVGEGRDASETGFTVGQASFSPKTVGAYTDITRRLLKQSNQAVDSLVRMDLMLALAIALDKAAISGTGGDYQPLGLKFQKGINAVDLATQQKPTFEELVMMESAIAADNADVDSMVYLANTKFRGHAKTTKKFPDSASDATIWETGNTVNGYRTEITNQVPPDDHFFGNWADLLILLWGGLDITVDTNTLSLSGGLRIVAFQDADIGTRRAESFCWASHLAQ